MLGERRKIAFVAHAAQQKIQRAVAAGAIRQRLIGRRQPLHQRVAQAGRAVVAAGRVTRNGALHHGAQPVVGVGRLRQLQILALHPAQRGLRLTLGQQAPAAQQLSQHQAGGKHIHLRGRRSAGRRLG